MSRKTVSAGPRSPRAVSVRIIDPRERKDVDRGGQIDTERHAGLLGGVR